MGPAAGSGVVQRFSIKKASDLLGKLPRGLRLRASLRAPLRIKMVPGMPGVLGIAVK